MVMGWLRRGSENADVEELIARRKYARAVELLRQEFEAGRRDPRLRLQLADVLAMAGRDKEAVPILLGLADEFARAGAAAKAISVLKKVERIAPGRRDVDVKLARLLKEKQAGEGLVERGPQEFREVTELAIEPVGAPREAEAAPPAAGLAGGEELIGLIEHVLERAATPAGGTAAAATAPPPAVASPLFDDFTPEELVEVIRGLRLRSFEPGDLIVLAGEPGESLFVVTGGVAKAFVSEGGRHALAREMGEGDFFGEVSILHGSVRTATVTAASRCEMLELDRATLEGICGQHPRVRDVMQHFCEQRLAADRQRRGEA